ncbi:MAG: hypothetical protein ACK4FP_10960 [Azonexus sp.]
MSAKHSQTLRPPSANAGTGRGVVMAGQGDNGPFNLRDTLSCISVRETSFSEFLAVLRQHRPRSAKP